jgi:regulator of sigma E protease
LLQSAPIWMWLVGFLLVLGPLVTLHELGHYLVGRLFGVKAESFSVGFGSEIAGFTDKRGTRWKLSVLPLGGYVQFAGDMNPASQPSEEWLSLPPQERAQTFQAKALWQRALIVAAGPLTNVLIAVAIFTAFNMAIGKPYGPPSVVAFSPNSPGRQAGLRVGDTIVAVDGRAIDNVFDLLRAVEPYPDSDLSLSVRRGSERLRIKVHTVAENSVDEFGNKSRIGLIGIRPSPSQVLPVGPGEAVTLAVRQNYEAVRLIAVGIGQIVTGKRSLDELGGPVKTAKLSGEQLSLGWANFVSFAALISINLAFINLLPIPALDGGHLAFYAAEAIRRKPASPRSQEWAFRTGVAFVLALMLFVTINDIVSLPIFDS